MIKQAKTSSEMAAEIKLVVDNWEMRGEIAKIGGIHDAVLREMQHDLHRDVKHLRALKVPVLHKEG